MLLLDFIRNKGIVTDKIWGCHFLYLYKNGISARFNLNLFIPTVFLLQIVPELHNAGAQGEMIILSSQ